MLRTRGKNSSRRSGAVMAEDLALGAKPVVLRDARGRLAPGQRLPGAGRKVGSLNKSTAELKAVILQTFEEIGGIERFINWADQNSEKFYSEIWLKLLPSQLRVEANTTVDFADVLLRARRRVDENVIDHQ